MAIPSMKRWAKEFYEKVGTISRKQRELPSWEKEFCTKIGLFQWEEFIRAKRTIYYHYNVMEWDDSANKEAFDNAKERFRASYFGLPCNVPAPSRDDDEVDWNSEIDPKLLVDLVCPEDLAYLKTTWRYWFQQIAYIVYTQICACQGDFELPGYPDSRSEFIPLIEII